MRRGSERRVVVRTRSLIRARTHSGYWCVTVRARAASGIARAFAALELENCLGAPSGKQGGQGLEHCRILAPPAHPVRGGPRWIWCWTPCPSRSTHQQPNCVAECSRVTANCPHGRRRGHPAVSSTTRPVNSSIDTVPRAWDHAARRPKGEGHDRTHAQLRNQQHLPDGHECPSSEGGPGGGALLARRQWPVRRWLPASGLTWPTPGSRSGKPWSGRETNTGRR
jgi:hypothetical protein